MFETKRHLLSCVGPVVALLAAATPGTAWTQAKPPGDTQQGDSPESLEEIVVTAQKRSQSLIDVPIAITAMTGEALQDRGFSNITDVADLVPGVRMNTPGGPSNTAISIRGVGQRDVGLHQEAPVATYVDGAYVSFSTVIAQPIYDLDRVEVLKGPQGTLFGRNATGGLIQFISRRPSDEFDAYTTVEYGSFDKTKVEGAIGGGLAPGLSLRFAFHTESGGDYMENLGGEDHNGDNNYSGRLQLLYEPNSAFSVLLNLYSAIWPDQPGAALSDTRLMLNAAGAPIVPPSFAAYKAFCTNDVGSTPTQAGPLGNCFGVQTGARDVRIAPGTRYAGKYYNATLTVAAGLGGDVNLTSITNYQSVRDYRSALPADSATGNPTLLITNMQPKAEQVSEELRLDGTVAQLHWVTGAYALQILNHSGNSLDLESLPKFGVLLDSTNYTDTKSLAAFAEGNYDITPQLTFILGGRLTYDSKHGINDSGCANNPAIPFDICGDIRGSLPVPVVAFTGYDLSFTNTSWSGRSVLQYKPSEDVMVFAGVNRGTKSGGFNSGGVEFYPVSAAQFAPEVLTNYEAGVKTRLFNRTLSLNASAFHYDYKNYQTFSSVNAALQVFNVDATVNGTEFDAAVRPVRGLELRSAATYLDSLQRNVPVGTGFADFPIPQAPRFSINASARYGIQIGPGEVSGLLSFTHVNETTIAAIAYPAEDLPAYDRYDLRLGYDTDKMSVAFNVRNLGDATIYTGRVPLEAIIGASNDGIDLPRTYTLSLTYRFGSSGGRP